MSLYLIQITVKPEIHLENTLAAIKRYHETVTFHYMPPEQYPLSVKKFMEPGHRITLEGPRKEVDKILSEIGEDNIPSSIIIKENHRKRLLNVKA